MAFVHHSNVESAPQTNLILNEIERKKEPRFDLNNIPRMQPGMGNNAAYLNGYRHGYEALNSREICSLTIGSVERRRWFEGYIDGSDDREGN